MFVPQSVQKRLEGAAGSKAGSTTTPSSVNTAPQNASAPPCTSRGAGRPTAGRQVVQVVIDVWSASLVFVWKIIVGGPVVGDFLDHFSTFDIYIKATFKFYHEIRLLINWIFYSKSPIINGFLKYKTKYFH